MGVIVWASSFSDSHLFFSLLSLSLPLCISHSFLCVFVCGRVFNFSAPLHIPSSQQHSERNRERLQWRCLRVRDGLLVLSWRCFSCFASLLQLLRSLETGLLLLLFLSLSLSLSTSLFLWPCLVEWNLSEWGKRVLCCFKRNGVS